MAAVLALAAWRVLSLGMADHYASDEAARALTWRPEHPDALLRHAERLSLDPAQPEATAEFARRALRANPLDGSGYRVLGQLAKEPDQAEALYRRAAARSPRDVISQAWLIEHYLKAGKVAAALDHADTLLRVSPRLAGNLMPVMLDLAALPDAQPVLAERLLASPPWGERTLRHIVANAPDTDAVSPLLDALRTAPGGLPGGVLEAWLDRLTREARWGQAYLTWVSQLPPERLQALGNVYNGGFEWEPQQGGFDWRFGRIAGARVSRMTLPGVTDGAALRVSFEDRRVPFSHVRQQLALPPGHYRLQLRARPDGLRTDRGLVWTLSCAPNGPALAETSPLRGSGDWRELTADFEVPAADCGGQWLVLRLPARIPAEQRIGGRAWFDDVKVVRVPASAAD
jgi:hypothetical protein